jgi:hypothetical protein
VDLGRYRWPGPDPEWAAANGFVAPAPPPASPDEEQPGQLRLF